MSEKHYYNPELEKLALMQVLSIPLQDDFLVKLYGHIVNNVLDIITVHTLDAKYIFITPNCYVHFGYNQCEMIGKTPFDFIHQDDVQKVMDVYKSMLAGNGNKVVAFRHKCADGHWLMIESAATLLLNENGEHAGFLISSRDITKIWEKDNAIKKSEEKYRSLVENSDAVTLIFDIEGTYLFTNSRGGDIVNAPVDKIVGSNIADFLPAQQAQAFVQMIQQIFTTKKGLKIEAYPYKRDKQYWFRLTLEPVFNSSNEVEAVMLNGIDITELKEYEQKIELQNQELKNIAYIQSHLVRSPLANILGLVSLLEPSTSPESKKVIDLINSEAQKLDKLITEIVNRSFSLRKYD